MSFSGFVFDMIRRNKGEQRPAYSAPGTDEGPSR